MTEQTLDRRAISMAVVSRLGIKPNSPIGSNTRNMMFHCPFHTDKTPSLSINLEKGIYNCFSCGRKGKIEDLYYEKTGHSIRRELGLTSSSNTVDSFSRFLFGFDTSNLYAKTNESDRPSTTRQKNVYINVDTSKLRPFDSSEECMSYIRKRHIPKDIARSMDFRYVADEMINGKRYINRLCIPIYENGRLMSIEGRRISNNDEVKVLYPCNSSVNTLYDIDNLDKGETLYCVEGLMDLAVLRSCPSFKNSTAYFGANVTSRQIQMMKDFPRVVVIPDSDAAGEKTLDILRDSELDNVCVMRLPMVINGTPIKDVGDLPKAHVMPADLVKRNWLGHIQPLK